jgi:formate dehydrogenase iron-sulfur subunit
VEVEAPAGRIAYGPVSPDNVPELFESGLLQGKPHPLCLGRTEEIPYLKQQDRLTFARCGVVDPLSLADYIGHDGYRGLERACEWTSRPS